LNGDLAIVKQEKFNPGHYFNGLQFRLLQWEFTAELLNENDSWWYGVSPADAQTLLDQKYISKKMYAGDPAKGTKGYLGYNTHNQFLETLLQSGIPGLVILLAACFFLVRIAWRKKRRIISFIIALLLAWLFSESVLERQFGIMIFTFFPLFFSLD
jgi:O-antigen ligase